jgi:hypothetical protein
VYFSSALELSVTVQIRLTQQDYSIWNYVWNHTIDYMWLSARVAEGSGTSDLSLPLHDDSIAELIKLAITSNSANKSFTRLHNPILRKIKLFKLDIEQTTTPYSESKHPTNCLSLLRCETFSSSS